MMAFKEILDTNLQWINDDQHRITPKKSIQECNPGSSLNQVSDKQGEGWILSIRPGVYAGRLSGSDKLQLGLTGSLKAFNER